MLATAVSFIVVATELGVEAGLLSTPAASSLVLADLLSGGAVRGAVAVAAGAHAAGGRDRP
jgi:hypothetical protein